MLKPDLIEFKPKTLAKSEEVNYNFEQMGNYVFGTADELKALVNSAVANLNLQLTQAVFTGKVEMYAGEASNIPEGWLLCDGQEVSREEYSKLYEAIGVKYGAGNGVTTFNVPNYIERVPEGSDVAGTYRDSALPNITGQMQHRRSGDGHQGVSQSGAFYITQGTLPRAGDGADPAPNAVYNFDASRSNSIYKNGVNKVQAPSLTTLFIIKT